MKVADGWRKFWFTPQPAYTLGLVRIAFGLLAICWTVELFPSLFDRFGPSGIMPTQPTGAFAWGVFAGAGDGALAVGWMLLLVSAIALTVGWQSRIAAILVFVLILSFERRNPYIFNAGDILIRIEALYLVLAPCGAALSLDQRRRTGSFWSAEVRSLWALRLMQVQVTIIYLCSVVAKLAGETWQNGTAVSYTLRIDDLRLLPTPAFLAESPVMANIATWGTILVELSIALLVWNRRWRPRVLVVGVVLHMWIMTVMVVGFFSLAVFVLYLAFVPPDYSRQLAESVRQRVGDLRARLKSRREESRAHAGHDPPGARVPVLTEIVPDGTTVVSRGEAPGDSAEARSGAS